MAQIRHTTARQELRRIRYGLAVIAVCGGLAYGHTPVVAWADTLPSNTASESAAGSEPDRDASSAAETKPVETEPAENKPVEESTTDTDTKESDVDEPSDEPAPDEDTDPSESDTGTEDPAEEESAPESSR